MHFFVSTAQRTTGCLALDSHAVETLGIGSKRRNYRKLEIFKNIPLISPQKVFFIYLSTISETVVLLERISCMTFASPRTRAISAASRDFIPGNQSSIDGP